MQGVVAGNLLRYVKVVETNYDLDAYKTMVAYRQSLRGSA